LHEAAIARRILDTIVEGASRHGARRITRLRMKVGQVSGVVPEALAFALEAAVQGTPAEGLVVDIETVPLAVRCLECGARGRTEEHVLSCPSCGAHRTEIVQGRELRLIDMDIDD
jgi:hydrogenase nickel incorporation protein HypA/HybF